MAIKFLEPGGKATGDFSLWDLTQFGPTVSTTPVGLGSRSIKFSLASGNWVQDQTHCNDTGTRFSFRFVYSALPTVNPMQLFGLSSTFSILVTTTGTLSLSGNGPSFYKTTSFPLSPNTVYRVSWGYRIVNGSNYNINVYLKGG